MKFIINKRTGRKIDNPYEARALVRKVKSAWPMVQADDHRARHGRSSALIAEGSDLQAIKEAHDGYISVYEGSEDCGFAGYKALFIGFKSLPENFEDVFTNYAIIG